MITSSTNREETTVSSSVATDRQETLESTESIRLLSSTHTLAEDLPSISAPTTPSSPSYYNVTLEEITQPTPILRHGSTQSSVDDQGPSQSPTTKQGPTQSSTNEWGTSQNYLGEEVPTPDPDYLDDPFWVTKSSDSDTVPPPMGLSPPPLIQFFHEAPTIESEVEDVDARPSAISIGVVWIFLVMCFVVLVCILDSTSWYRNCKRLRRNLRMFPEHKITGVEKYKVKYTLHKTKVK